MATSPPLLLIISGPAGSGKTTVCDRLLQTYPDSLKRLVTTTSRQPRRGEKKGVDYHFLSEQEFEEKIAAGEFVEWAKVHGRYYGSQRTHLRDLLQTGCDILLNIDVQGAQAFREEVQNNSTISARTHTVFIKPASMKQIHERLEGRRSDDEEEIARRLRTARDELDAAGKFDSLIVSGSREADFRALREIYESLRNHTADQHSP